MQHSRVDPKERAPPNHLGNSKKAELRQRGGGGVLEAGGTGTHCLRGGLPAAEVLDG